MHILILEAAMTGHHSGYIERIAAAYLEKGHSVTATVLRRDVMNPFNDRLKSRFGNAFKLLPLDDVKYDVTLKSMFGECGRELALRQLFGHVYRSVHKVKPVDYVFLPYLDYCLYAFGLLGSPFGCTQWGGICMRPSFHYGDYGVIAPKPKLANVKRALFLKLLRSKNLKSVYTIDELLHRFVRERHTAWAHRLQYVPDPAELNGSNTYESARLTLGIPKAAVVILVYGAIDERKGLHELFEALTNPLVPKSLHMMIAGRLSESVRPLMESTHVSRLIAEGRCHVIDGFLDDTLEQMVFVGADIVWLGYRNHYTMSGVLILAAIAGAPVLATQDGLIGWLVKEQELGLTIDINNPSQIIAGLKFFTSERSNQLTKINQKILNRHNWEKFTASILLS